MSESSVESLMARVAALPVTEPNWMAEFGDEADKIILDFARLKLKGLAGPKEGSAIKSKIMGGGVEEKAIDLEFAEADQKIKAEDDAVKAAAAARNLREKGYSQAEIDRIIERMKNAPSEPLPKAEPKVESKPSFSDTITNIPYSSIPTKLIIGKPPTKIVPSRIAPDGVSPLERVTYCPGLVGRVIDWMEDTHRRPNRILYLPSALALVAALLAGRVAGPTGVSPHLYVILLAKTAIGKQHGMSCLHRLLISIGAKALITGAGWTSGRAVSNAISRKPRCISIIDEYGSQLLKITGPKASPHESAASGELRKIWGLSFDVYSYDETADKEGGTVIGPALTIDAASTFEEYWRALQNKEAANGFLNRWVLIEFNGAKAPEREPLLDPSIIPEDIIQACKAIWVEKPTPFDMPVLSGIPKFGFRLEWGPGAKEVYDALSREIDAEENPERYNLRSRVADQAQRLATCRAGGRLSPVVSREDMEWGRDLALMSADMLCGGVDKYMREELKHGELCEKILSKLAVGEDKPGRMSDTKLRRDLHRHIGRGADFGGAVDWLRSTEQIDVDWEAPRNGGVKKKVWVLKG